jgi:EmrB/QacA subfamily drug resistance transporter
MTAHTTTPSRTRGILALAVLALPTLLVAIDISVLAVALPTMGRELHASATELLWMTDAYNFMVAGAMLTTGAIADRIGRRRMILVCAAIFAIASAVGAFATTPELVIAARGVMGLAGSAILPASMALLGGLFPDEKSRIQAMGAMMTVFLGGMAIAPFVGGLLLDHFWWGSVFLVNVPVTVLALVGLAMLVPNFRSPTPRPLDPAGMLLSIGGLVALAYGLIRAGQVAVWNRTDVRGPIVVGLVLLAVFVLVELRARVPSFDPRLLARRTFGGGSAALGLLLAGVAAIVFYNAFYLQGARGFSPMKAGLATLPTALGALAGAPLAPRLVRRLSLRLVAVPAFVLAALTMGAYGFLGLHTRLGWIEILLLIQGLSIAMVIGPVTAALIGNLPLEQAGAGSAVTNTVRQTGSVIGIAVGGTIMSITYRRAIEPSLNGVPGPVQDQARVSPEQARHAATAVHRPTLAQAADSAFIHAMHVGAGWIAAIALLGAAVLFTTLPAGSGKKDPTPEPDDDEARRTDVRAAREPSSVLDPNG